MSSDSPRAIMQPRCVHCLREQYAMAVLEVSRGELGCSWCGKRAPVFTTEYAYHEALRAARKRADAQRTRSGGGPLGGDAA